MNNISRVITSNQLNIVILFLVGLSFFSFLLFSQNDHHLLYADAISRLNIARKVIDNITPGIAQLGNVWLPLPQILMLPFVWNNYLWQSGIAGYLMSGIMYILCGVFIYKAVRVINNSFIAAFCGVLIYALNINALYLQTTAMSESIFMCSLAASIYFFLRWFRSGKSIILILAALSVSAMTLIRYEGLAILLSSIPKVAFYSYIKTKNYHRAEGDTLLYGTLAFLGFGLWTLYLTAIFGDPLYWKNFYASDAVRETYTGQVSGYTQNLSFIEATIKYFTSTVWMNGLIPVLMSMIAILVMAVKSIKNRTWYFLPLLMPLSIFLFMVLTLQRNTPIVQPTLSLENLLTGDTSYKIGFNIRYGILLLPWIAIMASYLVAVKNVYIKTFLTTTFIFIFGVQIFAYFNLSYSPIYQIPARIQPKPNAPMVDFMKQNYDGGPIFVSASGHEDQMFQMGFDYKSFIHEGTNKYWKESLDDPPRYAKWVIIDKGQNADKIAHKPNIEVVLRRDYDLVFTYEQVQVYKLRRKPYYEVN